MNHPGLTDRDIGNDPDEAELCWKCNGSGQLRNNRSVPGVGYVLGIIPCDLCEGTGEIKYIECEDCGAMNPVAHAADHVCSD